MKHKEIESYRSMDPAKLLVAVADLKKQLARLQLEMKAGTVKDSNDASKKKKELAVILTILKEKQLLEAAPKQEK